MKHKYVISILVILIAIGIVIGICIIKNDKKTEELDLINKDKISYIEIQYKNEVIKITNYDKIDKISNLFKKEMNREESLEDKKGWVYRVSIYDENDKNINIIYILNNSSIVVDGKGYIHNGQFISSVDEILGIKRDE